MRTVGTNSSFTNVAEFAFTALPWMQEWQDFFSILLALLLTSAVVGNIFLTLMIYREPRLHEPMYYFISMLSVVDLVLCLVTTPKILAILWFEARNISPSGCFTQIFFIHFLFLIESGIFVSMAFDRYIAICSPLRHASVLTNRFVMWVMVGISLRALFFAVPMPVLTAHLTYCSDYIIEHILCSTLSVARLSCNDITLTITYQLGMAISVMGSDLIFIFLSYCLILKAALKLNEKGAKRKALSTCISHLIVMLFFYSTMIVLAVNKSSKKGLSESTVLLNTLHFCVHPTLNPLVYGFRSKIISQGLRNLLATHSSPS